MFNKIINNLNTTWKHMRSIFTKIGNRVSEDKHSCVKITIGFLVEIVAILGIAISIILLLILSVPLRINDKISVNPNANAVHL
jgi:hypothetical protein